MNDELVKDYEALQVKYKDLEVEHVKITVKVEALQNELTKLQDAHAEAFQNGFARGFETAKRH